MTDAIRWRLIAYMAALFIAGAITGSTFVARTAKDSQTLKVGRSDEIAGFLRQKLSVLNLSPEQRERFEPMIAKASEQMEASHARCLKECFAAVENLHAQIQTELSPEQKEKLKQLDAERCAMLKRKYNYVIDATPISH